MGSSSAAILPPSEPGGPVRIRASYVTNLRRKVEAKKRRQLAKRARVDVFAFCSHVGRDKKTQKPLKLTKQHRRYIRALLHPLDPHRFGTGGYEPEQMIPDRNADLVALGHPNSGKTELASLVGLWVMCKLLEVGIWPLIVWAGDTKTVAEARCREWVNIIERANVQGEAFGEVFPKVTRGTQWNAQKGWCVAYDGVSASGRDATIRAWGRDSGVHGARYHIGIFDDVQTYDNQRGLAMREHVHTQFVSKAEDRRDECSWCWYLANAYYDDSPDAKLVRAGWRLFLLKVANAVDVSDFRRKLKQGTLRLLATFRWKLPAIIRVIDGPAGRVPHEADRKLFCVRMPSGLSNRYDRKNIEACYWRGGLPMPHSITAAQIPAGARIYTGIDIGGVKKKKASDRSCFFTIMVYGSSNIRRVLNIESGRWPKPELIERARDIARRYHVTRDPATGEVVSRHRGGMIVEDNAAQAYIQQDMAADELPVRPFTTTGKNKYDEDYGIDSMAFEFAAFRWEIPAYLDGLTDPVIEEWVGQMCGYSPEKHTGDVHMGSWIATMGAVEDYEYAAGHADDIPPEAEAKARREAVLHKGEDPKASEDASARGMWMDVNESLDGVVSTGGDGYGVG